jgi:cardiolipin synthase (CMP-forming)
VTIPNLLSLLRMGLTPVFVMAVVTGRPAIALGIFAIAGVTDALDGFIARAYGQQSRLGAYLDPIADKLLLMSAYVVLAIPGLHPGATIPVAVTVMVIGRDLIIVIFALVAYLALGVTRFSPSWLSKVNTTVQVAVAILVVASGVWAFLVPLAGWGCFLVAITTAASAVGYVPVASRLVAHERREGRAVTPPAEPTPTDD